MAVAVAPEAEAVEAAAVEAVAVAVWQSLRDNAAVDSDGK